jgi:hypothetical protein
MAREPRDAPDPMFQSAAPEGVFAPPTNEPWRNHGGVAPVPPSCPTAGTEFAQHRGVNMYGDVEQGMVRAAEQAPALQSRVTSVFRITVIAAAIALLAWAVKVFFGAKAGNRVRTSEKMRDFVYEMDAMSQEDPDDDVTLEENDEREDSAASRGAEKPAAHRERPLHTPRTKRTSRNDQALAHDPLYCFFESIS